MKISVLGPDNTLRSFIIILDKLMATQLYWQLLREIKATGSDLKLKLGAR